MTQVATTQWFNLHRRDIRVGMLLAFLCALLWLPPIVGMLAGYWPLGEDALAFFVPVREFAHQSLRQGVLPLWNPYTFFGMPFVANSQVAFWYPPNWLLGFFSSHWALLLDLWLHTFVLAVGGYVLARSLGLSRTASILVAVILALSSPVTARAYAGHMTWQAARAYFPWMLWATWGGLRKHDSIWWIRLSAFSALCLLAGHPPMFLLGIGLCVVLIGYWCLKSFLYDKKSKIEILRSVVWPFGAFLFAGLLAAAALLPMRELASLTVHGTHLSFRESAVLSGTWKTFLRLLAPDWFGGNRGFQWSQACCAHEESAYIGVLPFALAVLAPWLLWVYGKERLRVLVLWLVIPVSLLMALGANGPLYRVAWQLFPPLQLTRVPVRWLECWYLAGALLSGMVFWKLFHKNAVKDTTVEYSPSGLKLLSGALTLLTLLFLGLAAFVVFSSPDAVFWTRAVAKFKATAPGENAATALQNFRNAALFESLTTAILCGIGLSLLGRWQRAANAQTSRVQKTLVGFVVVNLLLVGWRSAKLIPPGEMQVVRWPPAITSQYQKGERWSTRLYWYAINGASPANIAVATGYDPLGSKRYFEFVSGAEGFEIWNTRHQPLRNSALWRVAGVTHTVTQKPEELDPDTKYPDTRDWKKKVDTGKWELWQEGAAWPLVYVTSHIVRVPERQQLATLQHLARYYNPEKPPVVVASNAFRNISYSTLLVKSQLKFRNLNQAVIETQSSQDAALVWGEAAFPGWRVWVNGQPGVIENANYVFQAVEIPKGTANIRFVYDSQTMRFAIFVSLCAGAFLVVCLVARNQKRDEAWKSSSLR